MSYPQSTICVNSKQINQNNNIILINQKQKHSRNFQKRLQKNKLVIITKIIV